ncbi:hypothetical protein EI42_06267 [Thermosporothrix hazakensis]|jgi:hypothetical protein|uniref:Uncharacterized protein n=1 Tax=Thermosporothrix hazakensis TaxID=644383 RepID=A0A326TQZ0_THEHA|nr:hypothetical protein [Thermosporothrix hazakensis]PZW18229.1 hypothetical protein EI42_06267 [Thermosporothrix hazakensis]
MRYRRGRHPIRFFFIPFVVPMLLFSGLFHNSGLGGVFITLVIIFCFVALFSFLGRRPSHVQGYQDAAMQWGQPYYQPPSQPQDTRYQDAYYANMSSQPQAEPMSYEGGYQPAESYQEKVETAYYQPPKQSSVYRDYEEPQAQYPEQMPPMPPMRQ